MHKIVGSDLDGTYDEHPELHGNVDFIVTGNSWEAFQDVEDTWEGPKIPIFYNPIDYGKEDLHNIIDHKAEIINKTGATDFYEDQDKQVAVLKILCPTCTIHLVKDDQIAL